MINDFNRRWCVGVKTNLNITRGSTQKTFMYIIVMGSYNFPPNTPTHNSATVCWAVAACLAQFYNLMILLTLTDGLTDIRNSSDGIISNCNCRSVLGSWEETQTALS